MIARVSDDRYKIVMDNEKPYGMGVFVDIYPYDGMGDTWKEAVSGWRKGVVLSSLCFQSTRKYFEIGHTKSFFMKSVKLPFYILSKAIGKGFFQKQLRRVSRKPYDKTKYIGNLIWGTYDEVEIYDRELFKESVYIDFEGNKFKGPKRFDEILRQLYGDYMKLPSEKERIPHHDYYVEKV
jgi:lipopolysaccharide cholinephosphotransferase